MSPDNLLATSGNASWMLMAASLVLLMTPALALFYGGMSSRRSVLNIMMMSFGSLGVVTVVYILWGWSMSYGSQSLAGIAANPFEMFGLLGQIINPDGTYVEGASGYANVIDIGFQLTFAVISTALISGALAERVKYSTWLVFSGAWATLVYFPLAHMVWGGGLLSHAENSISSFLFGATNGEANIVPIDFAGGVVVHISAGTAALVLALVIGKRKSFPKSPARPHNLPLTMLGAALLWFGWFGFNGGSAFAADGLAGLAWINTTAAAAAAMLGWMLIESIRDKAATSLGAASGLVAGLVTITPAAGALNPMTSLFLGFIGGILAYLGVSLKYKFGYDDSLDVVGVHLVAGLWGTVGVALVGTDAGFKLLIVQIVIAVIAMIFSGLITFIIAIVLAKSMGWRIDVEDEVNGIDLAQHRETAYDQNGGNTFAHSGANIDRSGQAPVLPSRTDIKE